MNNVQNEKNTSDILHPNCYNFGKYEVIDVINDWNLDFSLGCVVKYVARSGKKDPNAFIENLEKAKNYIDFEIKKIREEMTNPCQK